jgi:peptide/nickel transport system substrate-binding protein
VIDELIVRISNSDNIRINSSQKGEKMKRKLFFGLMILTLVALPLLSFSACGPTPVTTFTIGYGGTQLTSVDPCDFFSGLPPGVWEALVGFDGDNTMIPALAKSWEYLDGGKTLQFKLRDDIKFSSGDPFTAADVEFSLARNAERNMPVAGQLTQNYSGYEVVDDYTFNFYFPKVNVQFLPQTCAMMPITSKTYYDRVGEDAYIDMPVCTGPYKIVDWQEGQYIDLAYNEYWRGDKPQILEAHYVVAFDGATRVAMLQAGEVDLINQCPGANVTTLEDAGFARVDIAVFHDIVVWFDLLTPDTPWSDVRVRQAINYAIDKEAIIDSMLCGPAQEGVWLRPYELGYDPSLKPAYPLDLAKAQQLMADAGYAEGFDFPIAYAAWMEWGSALADYLASALAQININVELTGISAFPDFADKWASMHNAYVAGEELPPTMNLLFDVGWPGNPEVCINLTNALYMEKDNCLWDNAEVYDLVAEALQTLDNDARAALAKQAYAIINEELPMIPIVLEVAVTMMESNITYTASVGGMTAGPLNLIDLTVEVK